MTKIGKIEQNMINDKNELKDELKQAQEDLKSVKEKLQSLDVKLEKTKEELQKKRKAVILLVDTTYSMATQINESITKLQKGITFALSKIKQREDEAQEQKTPYEDFFFATFGTSFREKTPSKNYEQFVQECRKITKKRRKLALHLE